MSRMIKFADAFKERIINPGDYFLTTMPEDRCVVVGKGSQKFEVRAGTGKLWRLVDGNTMWGDPTEERLTLQGREGFEFGPHIMHRVARELHDFPGFKEVQSCSLPLGYYEISSNLQDMLRREEEKFRHQDDIKLHFRYWLASQCLNIGDPGQLFRMFGMSEGAMGAYWLYYGMSWDTYSSSLSIRPEAIPEPTLLLETDGLTGTRAKPWRCLSR